MNYLMYYKPNQYDKTIIDIIERHIMTYDMVNDRMPACIKVSRKVMDELDAYAMQHESFACRPDKDVKGLRGFFEGIKVFADENAIYDVVCE